MLLLLWRLLLCWQLLGRLQLVLGWYHHLPNLLLCPQM
jgi:hypothetical protein